MGGKHTMERLREIDPEVKGIVSSGYSNDPIMSDYRQYGFTGVIKKPYHLRDLSNTIHQVLMIEAGDEYNVDTE
jgi:DNA-binding NarL/FixJ family response regulator